jgi:hypothetical protein
MEFANHFFYYKGCYSDEVALNIQYAAEILRTEDAASRRARLGVFALFLGSQLHFDFIAQVYPVELVFLAIYVLNFSRFHREKYIPWWITPTLMLWFVATLISDLAAESDSVDSLKGALRVVFLFVDIIVISSICNSRQRLLAAWWGLCCGWVISLIIQPNEYFAGDMWKWGFAIPVTLSLLLLFSKVDVVKGLSILCLAFLAAIHFGLGFRSLALVLFGAIIVLYFRLKSDRQANLLESAKFKVGKHRVALVFFLVAATATIATIVYDRLSLSGLLGAQAAAKASIQGSGLFGSLLSGRSEFLLSLDSISRSFFLGHGSFSPPPADSFNTASSFFADLGYSGVSNSYYNQKLVYHSQILGSTADNGILASFFWIGLAIFLAKAVNDTLGQSMSLAPLVSFVAMLGLWDILFSPFGSDRRIMIGIAVATILVARIKENRRPTE